MTLVIATEGAADTRSFGRRLAGLCRPGDVILLSGALGSGKTVLAAGVAEGLGVPIPVTSPSFVLVRRYEGGFLPFVHADVYRLGTRGEVEDLDLLGEAEAGVLVIEWGEAVAEVMPDDHLAVELTVTGAETRTIRLVARGSWEKRPLGELAS